MLFIKIMFHFKYWYRIAILNTPKKEVHETLKFTLYHDKCVPIGNRTLKYLQLTVTRRVARIWKRGGLF